MSDRELIDLASILTQRSWEFSRDDGETFAPHMRLLSGGGVGNYMNPNEHSWRVNGGCLEFLRSDGTVTTRFDSVSEFTPGSICLSGPVIAKPGYIHILKSKRPIWAYSGLNTTGPRVAVLIRTHLVNPKLYHLFDCLSGSPFFDVYILADETRGRLEIQGPRVVSHTIEMCQSLGLNVAPTNHANVLWLCGDYPLYCAYETLRDYEYYAMIEFDVHMVRENPLFLEGIIHRLQGDAGSLDLVSTSVTEARPGWELGDVARRVYDKVYYGGIFSFVVASAKAIHYLKNTRLAEGKSTRNGGALIHCEAFVLTALMAGGRFNCASLTNLIPGCIGRSYHPGRLDLFEPNYLLGSAFDPDRRIEMMHPVLDARDYLTKLFRYHERNGQEAAFLEVLKSIDMSLVGQEIYNEFMDKAARATLPG